MTTKGIRRNNPGNLEFNISSLKSPWVGESTNQPGGRVKGNIISFSSSEKGLRALSRVIHTKYNEGGTTVYKLMMSYAPPSENPTQKYIDYIDSYLYGSYGSGGENTTLNINSKRQVRNLMRAIVSFENAGNDPYSDSEYNTAISDSLNNAPPPSNSKINQGQKVKTASSTGPLKYIDLSVTPLSVYNQLSPTNEAKYCFVNQCFSFNLQELLLQYSALANNYNAEYR